MAQIRSFRKIFGGTQDTALRNTAIEQAIQPVLANVLLNGILVADIKFTGAGTQLVEHKLGRQWLGYFVVKNGSTSVSTAIDLNSKADGTLFLPLMASGADTISIWVF